MRESERESKLAKRENLKMIRGENWVEKKGKLFCSLRLKKAEKIRLCQTKLNNNKYKWQKS